ncbi:trypco2 family protein [Leisingera sp. ANG-S3]|uniref:trypco2 family protein n=1 Tax=Leisingera sp. ANG-S3 TaxID=1577899 RepID=UPI00057EDA35|nr:trypco2 family protein [Leisingera sp. ANG-S3]KIC25381.1 hypothetical protein RA23_05805 [Leisingera sp. ANG-S3]
MDLKAFIKETTQAVIDATSDLQEANRGKGAYVSPEITCRTLKADNDILTVDSGRHAKQLAVQSIEYDVAVTAGSETGGEGGIKVMGLNLGGGHSVTAESVSRISFQIRIALPAVKPE